MLRISLLLLILGTVSNLSAQKFDFSAESDIWKKPNQSCVDRPFEFEAKLTGSVTPDSVLLVNNGKRLVQTSGWTIQGKKYNTSLALNRGTHAPILRYLLSGTWHEISLSDTLKVYDNPKADFYIADDTSQCFEGNSFDFKNASKKGADSASLITAFYRMGDGATRNAMDTRYYYTSSGDFNVFMQIEDENGCTDQIVKWSYPEVQREIGANFNLAKTLGCDTLKLRVKNQTYLGTQDVVSWEYHWGDGQVSQFTAADIGSDWAKATHLYHKDGQFSPKLIVESNKGCKDSLTLKNGVTNSRIDMDFTVTSSRPHCYGDSVGFEWKGHRDVDRFQWIFNDPASMVKNINTKDLTPAHRFVGGPSAYPITLKASTPWCPEKDTTICCVHVNGPAAIMTTHAPPVFSTPVGLRPEPIDKDWLKRLNQDPQFMSDITEVHYYQIKDTTPYTIPTPTGSLDTFQFPNGSKKAASYIDAYMHGVWGDTIMYFHDTFDYVKIGRLRIWKRNDPIPFSNIYDYALDPYGHPSVRRAVPWTLQNANPDRDSLVIDFPNFSGKYRFTEPFGLTNGAIPIYEDDHAWAGLANPKTNPSYPYASDSLVSFWDFDDPAAPNCISTLASPNPYCRYSREKTPRHIFTKNGCFQVTLEVTDTVVGCSNKRSMSISYIKPRAGFDSSKYTSIDWSRQNELLKSGKSLDGMGLRLEGPGCLYSGANPYFMPIYLEGVAQNCAYQRYWFIGDAESSCKTKVYIRNNLGQVVDSTYRDCEWIDETTMHLLGDQHGYTSPGWKSPGLVVQSGQYHFDTFFYYNYIYIPDGRTDITKRSHSLLDSISQKSLLTFGSKNSTNREVDSIRKVTLNLYKTGNTSAPIGKVLLYKDSFDIKGNALADLNDSMKLRLGPGQYLLSTTSVNERTCERTDELEFNIGHVAKARVKVACASGTTKFYDSLYYFHPEGKNFCKNIGWFENLGSCVDTTPFFYNGASIRQAKKARFPAYQLPQFNERIAWDFENDGTIDLFDQHNPDHIYHTGGEHICAMWTQDSLGVWQKDSIVFVVPDVDLEVSLAAGQSKYICPPGVSAFELKAKLYGDSTYTIYHGSNQFVLKDGETYSRFVPIQNKRQTSLQFKAASASGCLDTLVDSTLFTVLGANAYFEVTSATQGCTPYRLTAKNLSDSGSYRWSAIGLGELGTKKDLDTVIEKGLTFYPELRVTQRLIHPETNLPITCTSVYPGEQDSKPVINVTQFTKGELKEVERQGNLKVKYTITNPYYFHDYEFNIYQNGSLIDTRTVDDTSFVYTYPSAGDYSICLSTENGSCSDNVCKDIWIDYLSTPEVDKNSTEIYPNPAKNQVTVVANHAATHFELRSIVGQLLETGLLINEQTPIDISNLSEGIYVLTLTGDGFQESHRLVVER